MAISSDYSSPVWVNGFSCRNCAEVDKAKKNIDPANAAAGPNGVNDAKKAQKNHFSAEARQLDTMEAMQRDRQLAQASPVSAAYAAPGAILPGHLVNTAA